MHTPSRVAPLSVCLVLFLLLLLPSVILPVELLFNPAFELDPDLHLSLGNLAITLQI